MDGSSTNGWSKQFALDPIGPTDPVQFGRFRVLGLLSSGRLGESYLAASGEQLAVVKAVRPNTGNMLALREQMGRELAAIELIESPFVARVLASDVNAERPWFARQYVTGVTLERWVAEHGPVAPSALLGLAGQLATGLQELHGVGVVHRDLRPAKVLLSAQGACLVDFGVADVPEPGRLTQTRPAPRKRLWMAPEQVSGQPTSPATDVHAWALVVLFAASGRPPFLAAKASSTVIHPRLPRGTQRELAALVAAALVRNPAKRPTIAEICATLDVAATASPDVADGARDQLDQSQEGQVPPLQGQPGAQATVTARTPASGGAPASSWDVIGLQPARLAGHSPRSKPALGTMRRALGGALAVSALAALVLMVALRHEPVPTPSVAGSFRPTAGVSNGAESNSLGADRSAGAVSGADRPRFERAETPQPAIDPTGDWLGSAVRGDGELTYEVRLSLQGDPNYPTGTVRLRNIASNNMGSWEVAGSWRDGQLHLEPGVWLQQPNSSWARETLIVVALSNTRLVGTTSEPGEPAYPTGNLDLYR